MNQLHPDTRTSLSRSRRLTVALIGAIVAIAALSTPAAAALPGPGPDDTWMVNARVRALEQAGGWTWVGGKFTGLQNTTGQNSSGPAYLAAFGPNGAPAPITVPTLTGTSEIWDMFLAPDGVLYVAGKFNYTSAGKSYRNLMGIDPATGSIVQPFKTSVGKSVYADGERVYLGGPKLLAFTETGSALPGFTSINLLVDDSLRGHPTDELIKDMQAGESGWIIATGAFDYVNGDPQKVFFRFDPMTGAVDTGWAPSNIPQGGGAWGHKVLVRDSVLYSAAGGSDYVAAYQLGSGQLLWTTDTSGSAQSISFWDDQTMIVGGHFEYVEDANTPQCGSNQSPNLGCWHQPRLFALDLSTGDAIQSWTPTVCCQYNGVWITLVEGIRLHIGGEFNKVGGVTQRFYGRFTGAL